jgi:hypothetical protein
MTLCPRPCRSAAVAISAAAIVASPMLCAGLAFGDAPEDDDEAAGAHAPEHATAHHVAPPPAPGDHDAMLLVEVHGGVAVPIERGTICPAGPECVFGLGVGFGVELEWRFADRVGLITGYDFLLLDSKNVFELGTLHAVRGGLRYTLDDTTMVHPFIDATIGGLAFGDTASVATAGLLVTAGGGAELEIDGVVAFFAGLEAWLFATGAFLTRDGVLRANGFGVNVAIQITLGIAVVIEPAIEPSGSAP